LYATIAADFLPAPLTSCKSPGFIIPHLGTVTNPNARGPILSVTGTNPYAHLSTWNARQKMSHYPSTQGLVANLL